MIITPHLGCVPEFKNNPYNKRGTITEAVFSFIKANPHQPESVILKEIYGYHPTHNTHARVVLRGHESIKRIKLLNKQTNKQVFAYYITNK